MTIFSCNSVDQSEKKTESPIVYKTSIIGCTWPDQKLIDTTFIDYINFSLKTECVDKIMFVDTIKIAEDTMLIRHWKNIRFVINSNKFSEILLTKESLGDSLANDLRKSGFLTPPTKIELDNKDTSIILKTFIGFADSDFGDVYIIKVTKNGEIKVLGTEIPPVDQ